MIVSEHSTLQHFLTREPDVSCIRPTAEESDALVGVGCSIGWNESETHVLKIVVIDVKVNLFVGARL